MSCVKRVIEQYPALVLYFQGQYLIDNKANEIYSKLSDPLNKLYLYFLEYCLPILNNLTLEFQSQKPKIHTLYSKMVSAYKTILEWYINESYLRNNDISVVQYRNPAHYVSQDKIYLGGKCSAELITATISQKNKDIFINNCLNFYVECSTQIYKRFPFNSDHVKCLKYMSFIDPKNVKNVISITPVMTFFKEQFKNIDLNSLDLEWRLLRNTNVDISLEIEDFWASVKQIQNGNGSETFPLVNNLVFYILTLPHSTAAVERIFSTVNLNKTKLRNRLSTDTLKGILHSKNLLKDQSCFNFDIPPSMTKTLNNNMYK